MLHRRANKMSTILVYAVLEWVLIVLLLLNCLFYYIIRKFAKHFGLKPPCLLCSRVEYLLEPHKNTNTYENLMCETHATEISSLKYSFSHQKLAEFNNLCKNCFTFQHIRNEKIIKLSPKVAVFKWLGNDVAKNDDGNMKCSFCDEDLSSFLLLKPSWDILEHAEKTYLIAKVLQEKEDKNVEWNISKSDVQEDCSEGSQVDERPNLEWFSLGEAIEAYVLRSKPYLHSDDTIENTIHNYVNAKSSENAATSTKPICNGDEKSLEVMNLFSQISENSDSGQLILAEVSNNPTVRIHSSDIRVEGYAGGIDDDLLGDNDVDKLTDHSPEAEGNTCLLFGDEITSQTFINKELPNRGVLEFVQGKSSFFIHSEEIKIIAELSVTRVQINQGNPGPEELKTWQVEEAERWDGSVMSELEVDVGASTIERLKSVLEAEHDALRSLQAELEEERNAAAIAANQTMAMITRLQEEKSTMQMEALHYQRMMEEQSEYDQEALQILNDLIIKREKGKLGLEKDLEVYKKKVLDYEAKEKMMLMMKISESVRSINSSASSSNIDDDQLFIDFIHEETVDDHCDKYNTSELVSEIEESGRECMKHLSILDESIAQFEDERVSILEELKALEGKLFTPTDNNEETFEDRTLKNQDRDIYNEEVDESYQYNIKEYNGQGFSEKEQAMGYTGKRLVPLFDATKIESQGEMNEEDAEYESGGNEMEIKISIEEEVDHVYRRLQALEAEKEFLKHCFCSLKKGEKGRELLEEIYERLCELRTVEIQVRNRGD